MKFRTFIFVGFPGGMISWLNIFRRNIFRVEYFPVTIFTGNQSNISKFAYALLVFALQRALH